MATVGVSKATIRKEAGVVILPIKEYKRLLAATVPTYRLTGKAARDLDRLVEAGLRDHREGRTISAPSISSALKKYRRVHAR